MAVTDILLAPAKIYVAPTGEAAPADTIAFGTAWGGNWVDVGYTLAPLAIRYNIERYEVFVEQITAAVREIVTKESLEAETVLAEFTGANLEKLFNGAVASDTGAGASQPAKTEVVVGGITQVTLRQWGFEGLYENASGTDFPVRILIWRASSILNGDLQFAKAKETGMGLRITARADTSKAVGQNLMKIIKITAAATS